MSNVPKNNPPRQRLDAALVLRKLVASRSQAESYIKLGRVKVNRLPANKAGQSIKPSDKVMVIGEQYVSRAAHKLASVAGKFNIEFKNKTVLDVGSSTGGFSQYALLSGAKKVIAVDVGTNQLHQDLRANKQIELHEKTDIRDFKTSELINLVLIDVSFISLRQILPSIIGLTQPNTQILAMLKPQFEASNKLKHSGVVKNNRLRREIVKDFELWTKKYFVIVDKADSEVTGSKGNLERFYLLKLPKT